MKSFLLALAAGCAVLPTTAAAQSLAGEWDAAINTPGGVRDFKLIFQVVGDKLTGTVKRQAGDVPLVGSIKGDTVWFSYTIDYNGDALTLGVVALVAGDSLNGVVNFGGAAEDAFWARRSPKPPPAPQAPPSGGPVALSSRRTGA